MPFPEPQDEPFYEMPVQIDLERQKIIGIRRDFRRRRCHRLQLSRRQLFDLTVAWSLDEAA